MWGLVKVLDNLVSGSRSFPSCSYLGIIVEILLVVVKKSTCQLVQSSRSSR